VGSLGWTAVGEAVLSVVRSTQLAHLDSAAALALKLCSLSEDKRCSDTAAVATAATTAAPGAEQQHVKLELAVVKQEQAASGTTTDTTATVKSELMTAVKSDPAVKAEPTATAAASAADTVHTAAAAVAATVQDGAELVGRYVAALGLGLPIVDATAAAGSSTTAADDDDVAVVGVAARHSLRTLTLPQAQALVNMLVTLATPSADATAGTSGTIKVSDAPMRCEEELVSCALQTLCMRVYDGSMRCCICSFCDKVAFHIASAVL
jgi:hypothetical protein